jgi:hypothetical protein
MFRGMKKLRRNTAVYRTRSTHRRGTFHTVRRTDTTRNSPTPAATVQMSTGFGIPGTWVASTVRSGSATVTRTPTRKNTAAIRDTRLLRASFRPKASPIGIMAISAPRVNSPIPTTRSTAPAKNSSRVSRDTGAAVIARSKMIRLTGNTLDRASWVFSFSALLMMTIPPCFQFLLYNQHTSLFYHSLPVFFVNKW